MSAAAVSTFDRSTHSNSSPGTESGLLDKDIFSAGSAAGNLADVATFAAICPVLVGERFAVLSGALYGRTNSVMIRM